MIWIKPITVDGLTIENVRYKGGTPKSTKPQPLPPPAATPTEIIAQAGQARSGERAGRRLRKRTGRASSITTRPSLAFQPAQTQQAGLKTTLA